VKKEEIAKAADDVDAAMKALGGQQAPKGP
jgi:cell division protein ZapA (FtsZ GTPase activity inhibitor)